LGITLPQSVDELKSLVPGLDKVLRAWALEQARKLYKAMMEAMDGILAEHRPQGWRVVQIRLVSYQTFLGAIRVRRRVYQDGDLRRRYLLDEFLGMSKGDHFTLALKEMILALPVGMPYRRSCETLSRLADIHLSHQTLHRLVQMVAERRRDGMAREIEALKEAGELPVGEGRQPRQLFMEADAVFLSQQRQPQKKLEVKLGIAYEGWEQVSRDRFRTVNKTLYAAVNTGGDDFWAGMTVKLHKKYDLASVKQAVIGGDGASWVKDGAAYVGGRFQLDRYHLQRALTRALGRDQQTKQAVCQAVELGDAGSAVEILANAERKTRGEAAERIHHTRVYLESNASGLVDYRLGMGGGEAVGLRRTGAIEGNIDKFVARRMKNQGMSWSVKGARSLLYLRLLIYEGKLHEWLARPIPTPDIYIPIRKVRRLVTQLSAQEPDDWLKASMPALCGPHASRPWVTMLRSLVETPTI